MTPFRHDPEAVWVARGERRRRAVVSIGWGAASVAAVLLIPPKPPGDVWWPVLVVPLALPALLWALAPTALGRPAAFVAAVFLTAAFLVTAVYGAFVMLPIVVALWWCALVTVRPH